MLNRTAYLHFKAGPAGPFQTVSVPHKATEGAPRGGAPFMVLWAGKWRRVRIGGQGALYIGRWDALVQFA